MTRCEFLVNEVSLSCTSCTGWFCLAKGRKKKVGDTTICNNDEMWSICARLVDVYPDQDPLPPAPIKTLEEKIETEPVTHFDLPTIADTTYSEDMEEFETSFLPEIVETQLLTPPTTRRTLRALCPYYSAPPPGVVTCCGKYCYADDVPLRTGTQCTSRPSWLECVVRVRAVKRGTPYANT